MVTTPHLSGWKIHSRIGVVGTRKFGREGKNGGLDLWGKDRERAIWEHP